MQSNDANSHTSKAGRFASHPATAKTDYKIFLQAGAFTQRQNARFLRNRITRLNLPVDISVKFDSDLNLFKVHLGPFQSVETADNTSETLLQHQINNAYIVVD